MLPVYNALAIVCESDMSRGEMRHALAHSEENAIATKDLKLYVESLCKKIEII